MIIVHFVIAILITIGVILIVPGLYYKSIKEEQDKKSGKKSFLKFLFSKSFWAFFAIFMFGIPCFHGAIDLIFEGLSYIFPFHHLMFADQPYCWIIVSFYWILTLCILLVVPSVYFSRFVRNNEFEK